MTTVTNERPQPRPGLVGPVVLVALGVILLMNNLGLIGWGIWDVLFRLWPLLLIAIGLDLMIGRRSLLAAFLIALALLLVVGFAVVSAGNWPLVGGTTTIAIDRPTTNASRAEVDLGVGRGELYLAAMNEPAGLVSGNVRISTGARLVPDFTERDGVAYYSLRIDDPAVLPPWGNRNSGERWDLQLNPNLPLDLRVSSGVGVANLNLRALALTHLTVNSGVGEVIVTLPDSGRLSAEVNGGVGTIRITIPGGVAARIEISRGLGDVQVDGEFVRNGDVYESPGFAQAENRVDLRIDGGIGAITVRGE